ncbi:MAG: bis(5'-nucleosyl)-tetraphosphatase (symmetrical) [Gammaproteobacteria bacterium RIFCSPHIGHO2_12_FULL_38_11]|nr:MAG: bis(5'-nucleosyl)-tetraphosphatase (symmetrical) [Gammaproteobacteria bacterium RIFCSPHIGHO2_12_FULL_38_11]
MSTYIIGDVQGCFDSLQALLRAIKFNPEQDHLGFVGDLINRGPKSLQTLRFIRTLRNPFVVLGNHDLHLMALYFLRHNLDFPFKHISHTLQEILEASDCDFLINFLLQQPLMILKKEFMMTHAGIPPQWSFEVALNAAIEAQNTMRKNPKTFFENIYGNHPEAWNEKLMGWDKTRYIVNAFTRMRFCTREGVLDLENKTDVSLNEKYRPWFSWIHPGRDIYFGHWASLNGQCDNPRVFALDTGCAWGGKLTAVRVEDKKLFQVGSLEA